METLGATFCNLDIALTPRLIKVDREARIVNRNHNKSLLESANLEC